MHTPTSFTCAITCIVLSLIKINVGRVAHGQGWLHYKQCPQTVWQRNRTCTSTGKQRQLEEVQHRNYKPFFFLLLWQIQTLKHGIRPYMQLIHNTRIKWYQKMYTYSTVWYATHVHNTLYVCKRIVYMYMEMQCAMYTILYVQHK